MTSRRYRVTLLVDLVGNCGWVDTRPVTCRRLAKTAERRLGDLIAITEFERADVAQAGAQMLSKLGRSAIVGES